jgi:hypothetical protein
VADWIQLIVHPAWPLGPNAGPYALHRSLGTGGWGVVFCADLVRLFGTAAASAADVADINTITTAIGQSPQSFPQEIKIFIRDFAAFI